jgi:Ca2+-dependent lipid-binding protein
LLYHIGKIITDYMYSDLELKPVGTLEVKLVQARDLTNKDLIGKSDPFAIVYVRPLPDKMKRSKTIVSLVACL